MCTREEEQKWMDLGHKVVIGIDEAGCGCLAGPVTVCACYIPLSVNIPEINDSKKLTEKKRKELYEKLTSNPDVIYSVVHIDAPKIDEINILQSRFLGMYQATMNLQSKLERLDVILIDGNAIPPQFKQHQNFQIQTVVGGDAKCVCIAAASIIAKHERDSIMIQLDKEFPNYGWSSNKGYPAQKHKNAIVEFGITPYHRKTYKGCSV